MDALKNMIGGGKKAEGEIPPQETSHQPSSSSGGFLGGLGDKFNSAAGGGRESEKNEDYLDKCVSLPTSFLNPPTPPLV